MPTSIAKHLSTKSPQVGDGNGLSANVSSLSIKDSPKIQHKHLDVEEEFKRADLKNSASFVVVGERLVPNPLKYPLTGPEDMLITAKAPLWEGCCTTLKWSMNGPWKS